MIANMIKMKEEKSKKREISNWWYWILIIVFVLSMLGLMNNYKECVDDCADYVYDCVAYEFVTNKYSLADMCSSELEICIDECKS